MASYNVRMIFQSDTLENECPDSVKFAINPKLLDMKKLFAESVSELGAGETYAKNITQKEQLRQEDKDKVKANWIEKPKKELIENEAIKTLFSQTIDRMENFDKKMGVLENFFKEDNEKVDENSQCDSVDNENTNIYEGLGTSSSNHHDFESENKESVSEAEFIENASYELDEYFSEHNNDAFLAYIPGLFA